MTPVPGARGCSDLGPVDASGGYCPVRALAWNQHGLLAAVSSGVRLFSFGSGESWTLPHGTADGGFARFSADGKLLVTGGNGRAVHVHSTAAPGQGWVVSCVDFAMKADGLPTMILDAQLGASETLWALTDGGQLHRIALGEPGAPYREIVHPDEGRPWDLQEPRLLMSDRAGSRFVILTAFGARLLSAKEVLSAVAWGNPYGDGLAEIGPAALSPDGRLLAVVCQLDASDDDAARFRWTGPSRGSEAEALSADGELACLISFDDRKVRALEGLALESATAVAFSPEGGDVAVADASGGVAVWSIARPERPKWSTRLDRAVRSLSFAPHGQRLLALDHDNRVLLLPLTGGPVKQLVREDVTAAALDSDGASVALGLLTGRVWVVSLAGCSPIDLEERAPSLDPNAREAEEPAPAPATSWRALLVNDEARMTAEMGVGDVTAEATPEFPLDPSFFLGVDSLAQLALQAGRRDVLEVFPESAQKALLAWLSSALSQPRPSDSLCDGLMLLVILRSAGHSLPWPAGLDRKLPTVAATCPPGGKALWMLLAHELGDQQSVTSLLREAAAVRAQPEVKAIAELLLDAARGACPMNLLENEWAGFLRAAPPTLVSGRTTWSAVLVAARFYYLQCRGTPEPEMLEQFRSRLRELG